VWQGHTLTAQDRPSDLRIPDGALLNCEANNDDCASSPSSSASSEVEFAPRRGDNNTNKSVPKQRAPAKKPSVGSCTSDDEDAPESTAASDSDASDAPKAASRSSAKPPMWRGAATGSNAGKAPKTLLDKAVAAIRAHKAGGNLAGCSRQVRARLRASGASGRPLHRECTTCAVSFRCLTCLGAPCFCCAPQAIQKQVQAAFGCSNKPALARAMKKGVDDRILHQRRQSFWVVADEKFDSAGEVVEE
jgi:hypothetical protein